MAGGEEAMALLAVAVLVEVAVAVLAAAALVEVAGAAAEDAGVAT